MVRSREEGGRGTSSIEMEAPSTGVQKESALMIGEIVRGVLWRKWEGGMR